MKKLLRNNPLFTIFAAPVVVDVIGTVLGQPKDYWTSGFKIFSEAAPVYPLLQIHPFLFIAATLMVWLPFTYWLVVKLKKPLNVWATMALLVGHGYNSVSWLRTDLYRFGLFAGQDQLSKALSLIPMTIYILFIGWIATRGLFRYFKIKI